MSPIPHLPSDEEITAAVKKHQEEQSRLPNINERPLTRRLPLIQDGRPAAWLKYGCQISDLAAEADTQEFIYDSIAQQPYLRDRIRVPEVYLFIDGRDLEVPEFLGVIVIEYISGLTITEALKGNADEEKKIRVWDRAVKALDALTEIRPEPDQRPGFVGGRRIEHPLFSRFREYETGRAPEAFESVEEIQTYINKEVNSLNGPDTPNLQEKDLILCHCYPFPSNFIIPSNDDTSPVCVIDFEHCMWLPVSFMGWAFIMENGLKFINYIEQNLEVLKTPQYKGNIKTLDFFWEMRAPKRRFFPRKRKLSSLSSETARDSEDKDNARGKFNN
ncbi:Protein kinase-like (PK-like) [Glarea lozoyensis ATCC 20868]|uniref:Protein kinase-like (PK-like) n=1 Tax=Glarea lozoyensis (strain ATCC 20868 / MF5171) TaxID=1116229 RepID=S3CZB7_GLAL2|nr:Protein kinase-like (PK-like) [Glarea lozoyensis ATCC 20868]EPE31617.1 Protein kinase-like (PK-like) [Glarea lozoyensis ATCC 20868]